MSKLTNAEKEKLYDDEIAPVLLQLAKLAQDNGLSFVAGVEWEPGEVGKTAALEADASAGMREAYRALSRGPMTGGLIAITVTKP